MGHLVRWVALVSATFMLTSNRIGVDCIRDKINLEDHLQPLDVGIDPKYEELVDDGKLCSRNCTKYPEARICYYKLVAEQYHAMGPACKNCPINPNDCFGPQCITADGIERSVLVFNRMLPGPAFHICDGDRVVVDLDNAMPAREVSIHWHGQLQKTSPWEDGVPFVTQCSIPSNSKYRYDFLADTSGTHFYHSHSSLQLFDGLSGPFIVRTSAEVDPVSGLYDYDLFSHAIMIRDWFHQSVTGDRFPGYNKIRNLIGLDPQSYLINGRGSYTDSTSNEKTNTPLAEFRVERGKKYRFRIITDTSTTCSLQFTVENHPMLLIAADGYPLRPELVRTLYLSGADIYDVVIYANQPPRAYWIRVQGYGSNCIHASQNAILRYEGTGSSSPPTETNTPELFDAIKDLPELNNGRLPCGAGNLCLDQVQSLQEAPDRLLKEEPDQRFIFNAGTHLFSEHELYDEHSYSRHYLPIAGPGVELLGGMYEDYINRISNMFTPFALLLDPTNPLIDEMKCPDVCSKKLCECLHLIKLGYNNVVEMIIVDQLSLPILKMDHPFHLHGHHFSILKRGQFKGETFNPLAYKINSTNRHPLVRDSVPIPAQGYVIVRFIADNPGFWLLHCHFTAHNDVGMALVFQVGEPEQFLEVPENRPQCGHYLPPVY